MFGPAGQIHDFNPGIAGSGLFWTTCIDEHDVSVNPGNGRASMQVRDIALRDFHDLVNALLEGRSVPAVASFEINWTASSNKRQFHYPPGEWDANVVLNSAQVAWEARTATARFVSDPASTSTSLFAEVGHERNGVFFS
ncbi:MAG: hypothetical protein ACREEM_11790 [Blastocatellia bacterium]